MSEHTPGRWKVSPTGLAVYAGWAEIDLTGCDSEEQRQANACLIAAAPDLPAALRLILEEPSYELLETHRSDGVARAEEMPRPPDGSGRGTRRATRGKLTRAGERPATGFSVREAGTARVCNPVKTNR
jgi:hypothetical protein